jgi:hypothetical protein
MPSLRWTALAAVLLVAALPASAAAALVKVADPINVAPDDKVVLEQYYPDVAMAADGSFAVVYSEVADASVGSQSERVWVQRFSASLTRVGARIPVGPDQRGTMPAIAMAPDGRFAVALISYNTFPATPDRFVAVQRFGADGTPAGALLVPDGAAGDQDGFPPALAMADDGRIAVSWVAGPSSLRVRSYDAAGAPLTAATTVDDPVNYDAHPSIGMAGDGRFVLSWRHTVNPPNPGDPFPPGDLPAQRFTAAGAPSGPRLALYTGTAGEALVTPAIGMFADGGFFAAFAAREDHPGAYETDIYGRRFTAASAPTGPRFVVNDYTAYAQSEPDVAIDDDGDLFVAFEGQNGTLRSSYVRHYGASGTADGNAEVIASSGSGSSQRVHVDSDGVARTAIAYQSSGQGTQNEVWVARWNYAPVSDPPAGGGGTPPAGGGGSTPTPPATGQGTPVPAPAPKPASPARPKAPTIAQSVVFPSTKSCASRRNFKIRLRVPKGAAVTSATVKVNGKAVAVRKGARLRSTVDLRTLPKGRFTVSIELKLANGKTLKGERKYRTCVAKGKGKGQRPKV